MKFDITLLSLLLSFVVAISGWVARWQDKLKFEKQQTNLEKQHEKQQANLERQQAIQQAEAAAEKKVNEVRDFNHLLGNQKQISQGITTGFNEIEEKIDSLRELMLKIEAYLIRNQSTNCDE
ncbi:hypothetical protein [Nostoc sp.]|uniref:hypothetical protein n=1 Tax=Nostoc sp. TaxID=1180 RepID=UPI002FFA1BDD